MRSYRTGFDLEEAIFGHSGASGQNEGFRNGVADFSDDVTLFIRESSLEYPGTFIGKSLHQMAKGELERFHIDTSGFVFISAINTKSDVRHHFDGLFFLPSVSTHPVTVDVWNMDPKTLSILEEIWIGSFEGQFYSERDCQSDLFRYKVGMVRWMKKNRINFINPEALRHIDFRQYAINIGRSENHFIFTSYHAGDPRRRRAFAKMVARSFAKVSGQKMAELSH